MDFLCTNSQMRFRQFSAQKGLGAQKHSHSMRLHVQAISIAVQLAVAVKLNTENMYALMTHDGSCLHTYRRCYIHTHIQIDKQSDSDTNTSRNSHSDKQQTDKYVALCKDWFMTLETSFGGGSLVEAFRERLSLLENCLEGEGGKARITEASFLPLAGQQSNESIFQQAGRPVGFGIRVHRPPSFVTDPCLKV